MMALSKAACAWLLSDRGSGESSQRKSILWDEAARGLPSCSIGERQKTPRAMIRICLDPMQAEDTGDSVTFLFESPGQERHSDFELKLMDIDSEQWVATASLPDEEAFPGSKVVMSHLMRCCMQDLDPCRCWLQCRIHSGSFCVAGSASLTQSTQQL